MKNTLLSLVFMKACSRLYALPEWNGSQPINCRTVLMTNIAPVVSVFHLVAEFLPNVYTQYDY
jgi:hypothetical protein